jgi:hypothetical protein
MVMIPDLIDLDENLDAPIPDRFADLAESCAARGMTNPWCARSCARWAARGSI